MRQRLAYATIFAAGALAGSVVGKWASTPLLLCFVGLMLLTRLGRLPPREGLMAEGKAFTVAVSLWFAGAFAALLALSLSQARWMLSEDATALDSFRTFYRVLGPIYVALAVVVTGQAVLTLWRPVAVTVMREGVGNSWHRKVVRWEDIPVPVTVSGRWRGTGTVTLAHGKVISGVWFTSEPWYIARVIEYYRVHPEHRAAIGTREELARLKTALPAWFEAYQRSWR